MSTATGTLERFDFEFEAEAAKALLAAEGIAAEVQREQFYVDITFGANPNHPKFALIVPLGAFQRAHEILAADKAGDMEELNEKSDEALIEMLCEAERWPESLRQQARHILAGRDIHFSNEELEALESSRYATLKKPRSVEDWELVLAFLLAFAGGFIGLAWGWLLMTSKRTLPNGEQVWLYDAHARRAGRWLIGIGAVASICVLIWFFGESAF